MLLDRVAMGRLDYRGEALEPGRLNGKFVQGCGWRLRGWKERDI